MKIMASALLLLSVGYGESATLCKWFSRIGKNESHKTSKAESPVNQCAIVATASASRERGESQLDRNIINIVYEKDNSIVAILDNYKVKKINLDTMVWDNFIDTTRVVPYMGATNAKNYHVVHNGEEPLFFFPKTKTMMYAYTKLFTNNTKENVLSARLLAMQLLGADPLVCAQCLDTKNSVIVAGSQSGKLLFYYYNNMQFTYASQFDLVTSEYDKEKKNFEKVFIGGRALIDHSFDLKNNKAIRGIVKLGQPYHFCVFTNNDIMTYKYQAYDQKNEGDLQKLKVAWSGDQLFIDNSLDTVSNNQFFSLDRCCCISVENKINSVVFNNAYTCVAVSNNLGDLCIYSYNPQTHVIENVLATLSKNRKIISPLSNVSFNPANSNKIAFVSVKQIDQDTEKKVIKIWDWSTDKIEKEIIIDEDYEPYDMQLPISFKKDGSELTYAFKDRLFMVQLDAP